MLKHFYEFPEIDRTLLQIFCQLNNQPIQSQMSACLRKLSVQIDLNCLEKAGFENLQSFPSQANATLSFFVFKLFLKTLLPAILMHKNNTRISYEMFILLNKLLTETPVASMITVIEPMDQVVTSLVLMIKERPLLET